MDTQNSFSTIIKQFSQMNANAIEAFERINQAVTSSDESVTISVDLFGTPDDDGNTTIKTYQIPSFGYLDKEIKRLERNLQALSGVGTADTTIKLPDGSFKRILTQKLKTPAQDLTSLSLPTTFETTDNDFFEDFLNPLLTVKFDVSGQIAADTERVLVKRYIFPSSDGFASTYFDDNYANADELDYFSVLNSILIDGVNVTVDEQVRDLPFKTVQYYGKFDITAIENVEKTIVIDGEDVIKKIKLYTLNKLTYTDSNKDLKDSEFLSIGDQLLVNSGNDSTRYEIENIYSGTSQIQLKLIEGFDPIKIGVDQLCIYKSLEDSVSLSINVGFDEKQIVFFKSIDPNSKILAENWSPGVGFYSNNLSIQNANGEQETLSSYYKNNVADFGQFIRSLKDDFIPPATAGLQPEQVELDAENFKVVQINTHLTANDAFDSIKKLSNDKITVLENIKKLDETIVTKRSEIATKKYKSDIQKNKDKNNLASLVEKRSSEAKLYSSIVNQIKSINSDQNITEIKPKFRVRGFWKVPEARNSEDTLPQEIIKFKIQYRYISPSGKTSNIEQIPLKIKKSGKIEKITASFSNWVALETPTRQRKRDSITGKYIWITESVEDGQEVNFNQLDLPINLGENIEIRIKAVSEAGYPANPMESEWSDIIKIEFPEGLLDTSDVINLIEENAKETTYVQLVDELDSKGLYTHISDSFIANERYYSHGADKIASGFLSAEQTPISLFDKLIDLQKTIDGLINQIENAEGELIVTIVDEEGKTTEVEQNTTTRIFAGYYVDEVADLNIKKGHIVTKTYKILLENTKATDLELIARMIGDRNEAVYPSSDSGPEVANQLGTWDDFTNTPTPILASRIENDTYYRVEGKYDLVPIQYQNISSNDVTNFTFYNVAPFQSSQKKGQWIYGRYMNVSGEQPLYATETLDSTLNGTGVPSPGLSGFEYYGDNPVTQIQSGGATYTPGAVTSDFVWDGNITTPGVVPLAQVAPYYDDSMYFHVDHPDIDIVNTTVSNGLVYNWSIMSQFATLDETVSKNISRMQAPYAYEVNRSIKMSFEDNDIYLLGGRSCGAYLFMSPISVNSIVVDGDNKFGKRRIGSVNTKQVNSRIVKSPSLSVDIIFQYRMTDYFGLTAESGVDQFPGMIKGKLGGNIGNFTYAKKMGFDIFDSNDNQFSFDLEVFAKYKPIGKNLNNTSKVILSKQLT